MKFSNIKLASILAGVAVSFGALLLSGCATNQEWHPETNGNQEQVARFHVGYTVIVNVTGVPVDITPHQEAIKEDGTITLPDIGKVKAAGKTAGELQDAIRDLYVPSIYTRATVTVNVGDRVYYVRGEVKAPGRQVYTAETTVTRAITAAGDFTDFSDRKNVWLIRASGQRFKINCFKALEHPELDPPVYPGDQIEVKKSWW